jgi:hypothetical protein
MSTARDLQRGWRLPADGVALELSGHALRRWSERISGMPADRVMVEVAQLLGSATVSQAPPPWAEDLRQHTKADAWLVLDDLAAAPLRRTGDGPAEVWTAATVVTPATSAARAAGHDRRRAADRHDRPADRRRPRRRLGPGGPARDAAQAGQHMSFLALIGWRGEGGAGRSPPLSARRDLARLGGVLLMSRGASPRRQAGARHERHGPSLRELRCRPGGEACLLAALLLPVQPHPWPRRARRDRPKCLIPEHAGRPRTRASRGEVLLLGPRREPVTTSGGGTSRALPSLRAHSASSPAEGAGRR